MIELSPSDRRFHKGGEHLSVVKRIFKFSALLEKNALHDDGIVKEGYAFQFLCKIPYNLKKT